MADQVLGDSCLRHLNTEFQQLPLNARSAPRRIGETHSSDDVSNFTGHRRTPFATAALPLPVESEALSMPCNDLSSLTISRVERQAVQIRTVKYRRCGLSPQSESMVRLGMLQDQKVDGVRQEYQLTEVVRTEKSRETKWVDRARPAYRSWLHKSN
jgi:hypothetical protein